MCPNFPQYDSTGAPHPRPPPRPEGSGKDSGSEHPVRQTGHHDQDLRARHRGGIRHQPERKPSCGSTPAQASGHRLHASRGEALRRPDLDPRRAHHFSRPAVPTTFSWEQLPNRQAPMPGSRAPRRDAGPGLGDGVQVGRTPMSIRENGRPGETLVANWPSKPRKGLRNLRRRPARRRRDTLPPSGATPSPSCRGALVLRATVAFGEKEEARRVSRPQERFSPPP